jgi:hypothetical protein
MIYFGSWNHEKNKLEQKKKQNGGENKKKTLKTGGSEFELNFRVNRQLILLYSILSESKIWILIQSFNWFAFKLT